MIEEEDEKNVVTIDFLSAGTSTLGLIKVGGAGTTQPL